MKSILLSILLSSTSFLATADFSSSTAYNNDTEINNYRANSKYSINATFSPVNFPFPLSIGVNGYYKIDDKWSMGADFLKSSLTFNLFGLDIGQLTETNYTILAKRYYGDSLNMKMGIGARYTDVTFGPSLLKTLTPELDTTVSELEAKYIRLGLGNVWHYKKQFTIEVDWITIDIPINAQVKTSVAQYADNESDADDIRFAESLLKFYPGASILKFNAGFIF